MKWQLFLPAYMGDDNFPKSRKEAIDNIKDYLIMHGGDFTPTYNIKTSEYHTAQTWVKCYFPEFFQ